MSRGTRFIGRAHKDAKDIPVLPLGKRCCLAESAQVERGTYAYVLVCVRPKQHDGVHVCIARKESLCRS